MVLELIHQLNVINWNSGSSLLFSSAIISGGTSSPHDHKQMLAFIFTNNDVWKQEREKNHICLCFCRWEILPRNHKCSFRSHWPKPGPVRLPKPVSTKSQRITIDLKPIVLHMQGSKRQPHIPWALCLSPLKERVLWASKKGEMALERQPVGSALYTYW